MSELKDLIEYNRRWAAGVKAGDPDFFLKLSKQQSPRYLWIGCSDSRVPANQIVGLPPGEVFVHRNVGNIVLHSDCNCLAVIQYAVSVLKVRHIIVCGHYGCGGVQTALSGSQPGLINDWLGPIKNISVQHQETLAAISGEHQRLNRLCELNVIEQVRNTCNTAAVQDAWRAGQKLSVHGWIYAIEDGLLHELDVCISAANEI